MFLALAICLSIAMSSCDKDEFYDRPDYSDTPSEPVEPSEPVAPVIKCAITDANNDTIVYMESGKYFIYVMDSNHTKIGTIFGPDDPSDYTSVYDGDMSTVGRIYPDGTATYVNKNTVGHIYSDGTVTDVADNFIGRIGSDGTIEDAEGNVMGHIDNMDCLTEAAYIYFFTPITLTGSLRYIRVYGKNNMSEVGEVDNDGTVIDGDNYIIGYIDNDGTIRYSDRSVMGYIADDGTVTNKYDRVMGYIGDDGTVSDRDGNLIGNINLVNGKITDNSDRVMGYIDSTYHISAIAYIFFFEPMMR